MVYIILTMIIIALVQVPALVREKQWWTLAVFIFLWLTAGSYAAVVALNLPLVSPNDILSELLPRLLPLPGFLQVP